MHPFPGARLGAGLLLVLMLCGCSGSSDEQPGRTDVSTGAISFKAAGPDVQTPSAQIVTATLGSDVAHIGVVHSGVAIARVSSELAGRGAQITIEPAAPSDLGAGVFKGAIAVTGYICADAECKSLAPGATRTISVTYQISPVVRYVAPYVAIAGESGEVMVRGLGFQQFAIQGVTFGSAPGVEFELKGDREILATYGALEAGAYPVHLDAPAIDGGATTEATLVVVPRTSYAAETLSYPTPAPNVRALIYDAERAALLVATDAGGGTVLRYPYEGGWGAPASASVDKLQDIALSINGARLLALSQDKLTPLDPVTLAAGEPVKPSSLNEKAFLKNIAVSYDDNALITTGSAENIGTLLYMYAGRARSINVAGLTLNNSTPAASADGSLIVLTQGHPSMTTDPAVFKYTPSTGMFPGAGVAIRQSAVAPVLDRAATRIVLNGVKVYDSKFDLLGLLPDGVLAVALSPDGSRAYTYDGGAIRTFDISADNDGKAYAEIGAATPLAGAPGQGARMTITPDGSTLFLAGSEQLVVQPAPGA